MLKLLSFWIDGLVIIRAESLDINKPPIKGSVIDDVIRSSVKRLLNKPKLEMSLRLAR